MARLPRAVQTRIAATITARYFPSSGASDGFYLDGRPSGRREHRAADITLDREDRGFFYSIFAHASGNGADDVIQGKVRKALEKIYTDSHQSGRNIDSEINELAECAVSVAGRITLHHDGVRQPYFAGIVVKDSELAAVTMGGGCAYLYRGDVLYPLTADDYPLDAVDGNGKPVQAMDVYCAGVAGTVRYSNIAQLQLDDCIIICNKEIMDALGQRDILRMLYEAEDQADAAGLIITAASAKLPGVPLQILIGFVENISSAAGTSRVIVPRTQPDSAPARAEVYDQEDDFIPAPISNRGAPAASVPVASRQNAIYDDEDDFDNEPDHAGRGRRIAFYVVIAIICIGCIYAIWSMLFPPKQTNNTTFTTPGMTTSDTQPSTSVSESVDPSATTVATTAGTTAATTTPAGTQSYTVVSGDSLTIIANKFYGSSDPTYIALIKTANGLASADMIYPGDVLQIPPKP